MALDTNIGGIVSSSSSNFAGGAFLRLGIYSGDPDYKESNDANFIFEGSYQAVSSGMVNDKELWTERADIKIGGRFGKKWALNGTGGEEGWASLGFLIAIGPEFARDIKKNNNNDQFGLLTFAATKFGITGKMTSDNSWGLGAGLVCVVSKDPMGWSQTRCGAEISLMKIFKD